MMNEYLIYKYPFYRPQNGLRHFSMSLPRNSKILSCQVQDGEICFWVLFPVIEPIAYETQYFKIVGTGKPFNLDQKEFIATVQQPPFVWHIFKILEQKE